MQGFGDYAESDTASACKRRDYKDATDKVCRVSEDKAATLGADDYKEPQIICLMDQGGGRNEYK